MLSFWLERLYLNLERRSGNILSYIQLSIFSFWRNSSSSFSLSTVLNYYIPEMQDRSNRALLLFLIAISFFTDFTQSRNQSFISLQQAYILLGLLCSESPLFDELASDPNRSRNQNWLLRLFSSFAAQTLRFNLAISSFFLSIYYQSSYILCSNIDLFISSIFKVLICSFSWSSIAKCSFSASLILPLSSQFSCVSKSTFEYSLRASSLKITISFSRY